MATKQQEELVLRLERTIRTTPERAFAAWTRPELLRQWSAPEGMEIEDGETDLHVGGRYSVVMTEADGTKHMAFGVYKEITPPAKLVYTHAWREDGGAGKGSSPETIVTVEFRKEGEKTRVVLTQTGFANAASREGHKGGWSSSIDRLVKLLEGTT